METPRPEVQAMTWSFIHGSRCQDLLIFWRGCSAANRVLLAANFHTQAPHKGMKAIESCFGSMSRR